MPRGHGGHGGHGGHRGHHHHSHNHHHHHHLHQNHLHHQHHQHHRRRVHIGRPAYGSGTSKAAIKCFIIIGVVLVVVAIILIFFGALCISGVLCRSARFSGTPLLCIGAGILVMGLVLLLVFCLAAMQQGKVSLEQTTDQEAGQSTTNPAVFPATPVPPPPFQPAAQPFQPPPYTWTSPAPFDGAPAPSVQGPYSGFQYTSFPDSGSENSNPNVAPWVTTY